MSLTPGDRLGPYLIADLLGQGGMGQVYRARDTRLDRDVAIKILPEAFARDPDRLARFEREAKTLASLNHPSIAQIYGVEDTDGIRALVMELVDGVTLAEVIDRAVDHAPSRSEARPAVGVGPHGKPGKDGGIPVADALAIARQICEALETAHEAGIIHRDLKPANIKVRDDGTVKVLDFGLAKLVEPGGGDASGAAGATALAALSQSPTMTTPAMTQAGMILGTAAYMSPEQAKGRPADKRSDVWSFGCVLYEMLTGKRAFEGDDVSDTLAAILRGEPDWAALPATTPVGVRKALGRCLEKDRKKRLRDIGDVNILIEDVAAEPVSQSAVPAAGSHRSKWIAWGLASALVLSLAALALAYRPKPVEPQQAFRFQTGLPAGVSFDNAGTLALALSPDGRRLAGVGLRGGTQVIFVHEMDALDARILEGTESGGYPFWSPDNHHLGFFAGGALKVLDTRGGSVRTLCPAPGNVRGGTWNRDDVIVFASSGLQGLFKVSANGGASSQVTKAESLATGAYRFPSFLPDGRRFLFSVSPMNEVRLGSLDSSDATKLPVDAATRVQFAPPGHLLYVRDGSLVAQPFDAGRGQVTGEPVPVAEQVLENVGRGYASFSASADGGLVYITGGAADETRLTWFDRTGKVGGTVGPPGRYRNPVLSPDEKRVAVEMVREDRNRDIWLLDVDRGTSKRFTLDPGNDVTPIWSQPDGGRLAFGSDRNGGMFSIYHKASDSVTAETLLFKSTVENAVPYSWSPDGKFMLHRSMNNGQYNIGVLSLDGEPKSHLFNPVPFLQSFGHVSPNGRWMIYHSNETGRVEVFAQTFPVPGGVLPVSKDGGIFPMWRADGKELFYYGADSMLMSVRVSGGPTLDLGAATPLFKVEMLNGPNTGVGFRAQYDVTRDGQQFLINLPVESAEKPTITVLLNWPAVISGSK